VACGFTSFELGTDIGGSVRIPSHFNGVFGLKPSFGVVPQRGYIDHVTGGTLDADINVFGPLARSAEDLALLLDVMAGPVPEDAVAWRLDLPAAMGESLSDYRIGLWLDDEACAVDGDYAAVLQAMATALAGAGAKAEESHPPVSFREQSELFHHLVAAATSLGKDHDLGERMGGTHLAWLERQERRVAVRALWSEWFADHDILLCPVVAALAFPHDHEGNITNRTIEVNGVRRTHAEALGWTGLIGIVNLPSVVVPIGVTAGGLPCGVQVVAPYLQDRRAIKVAALLAEIVGGYRPPPGY
jgi:amidase